MIYRRPFSIKELRQALDLAEQRYPDAQLFKGEMGDLFVIRPELFRPDDDEVGEVGLINIRPGCDIDWYVDPA